MIEIIPTCVPQSTGELASCAKQAREFTSTIHIDIDDGLFAPHLTWPYTAPGVFTSFDLSPADGMSVEVHLMVKEPREVGMLFARAGAARIIAHMEAFADSESIEPTFAQWREAGTRKVGLALLWQTPVDRLDPFVASCDVVHLMSITRIGTQGIPYEPESPVRIAACRTRFPKVPISIDGGINETNIADLVRAGATRFGVGSAIEKSENPADAYARIKQVAESALQ